MNASKPGITFRETMSGGFALGETDPRAGAERGKREGSELALHGSIEIVDIDAFVEDPDHCGGLEGAVDFTPFGEGLVAPRGVFNLFKPSDDPRTTFMVYELAFAHEGADYYLAGKKEVRDDPGFDLWKDTTTLFTRLHAGGDTSGEVVGAGVLTLGISDLMKLLSTVRTTGADSVVAKTKTVAKFGSFFLGELWDSYARFASS